MENLHPNTVSDYHDMLLKHEAYELPGYEAITTTEQIPYIISEICE